MVVAIGYFVKLITFPGLVLDVFINKLTCNAPNL